MAALLVSTWASSALAQDYEYTAELISNSIVRAAPSADAEEMGRGARGLAVNVTVCFKEGVYCLVEGVGVSGFIAGELLRDTISGRSLFDIEQEKWARIGKDSTTSGPQ